MRELQGVCEAVPSSVGRPPICHSVHTAFRTVQVVLSVFLLTAAALKAHGLALGSTSADSFLFSPRLQVVTIEVEVLLGLWLLSGWSARPAWMAAVGFFGILAGVSLYLALAGQTSCGCFGRVDVNPWLTCAFDVAAMMALVLCRPQPAHGPDVRQSAWLTELLKTGLGTAAILVLIGGAFLLAFDNPADALAQLRGESLTVEPNASQVGDGVPGEERVFAIRLRNHTDRPIRVVGGTTDCSCLATGDLPTTVPAGESRPILVQMTFRGEAGRFQHRFVLYTDADVQRTVVARFAGRVVKPPSP